MERHTFPMQKSINYMLLLSGWTFFFILLAMSSFHKKSTRDFLLKMIREDWGFPESDVVAEMRFDIPKSYKFHKSKSKDVEVDLIRIFVGDKTSHDGNADEHKNDPNDDNEDSVQKKIDDTGEKDDTTTGKSTQDESIA